MMSESRVAIVAVHGIGPAQRYALQDEVAQNLAERLPGKWERTAFFPPSSEGVEALNHGSALRLERTDERGEGTVYDVYEAYWSPIDKNRTSVRSVLSWLMNAVFAPLNAVTPLPATGAKLALDLAYIFVAVCLVFVLPMAAIGIIGVSYAGVSADRFERTGLTPARAAHVIHHDLHVLRYGLQPEYLLTLILGVIGWYIVAHVVLSMIGGRARDDRHFSWQKKMRLIAVLVGGVLITSSWLGPVLDRERLSLTYEPLLLLIGATLIRLAITLSKGFFVNRLGDIQIYTTADYNCAHYDLRNRILDTVRNTIGRVLTTEERGRPYYERVYVVAHSLGSTIALDALIQLRQAVEAGDVRQEAWERIKAFITLGTALEKTKFFFAARNPTLTESFLHWRNDIYGKLFTRDPSVLSNRRAEDSHAIFWANYWYFRDIVANDIVTYHTSDGESICYNVRLHERGTLLARPWVHSDYLSDPHFWDGLNSEDQQQIGVAGIIQQKGEYSWQNLVTQTSRPYSP